MKKLLYTTAAVVAGVMLFSSNVYAGAAKISEKEIQKIYEHTDGRDKLIEEAGRLVSKVLAGDMTPDQLDSAIETARNAGVPPEDLKRAQDIWKDRLDMKDGIADLKEAVGKWDPATKGTIAQAITDLQNGQGSIDDLKKALADGDAATLAAAKDYTDGKVAGIAGSVADQVKDDLSGDIASGDAATLAAAKEYADNGDDATLGKANKYTDDKVADIAGGIADQVKDDLSGDITAGDAATLAAAKQYANDGDADTLAAAKQYADNGDAATLGKAKDYTDDKVAGFGAWTPSAHNGNTMADQVADNTAGINGINQKLANGDIATKETVGAAKQEAMDYADAQDAKLWTAAQNYANEGDKATLAAAQDYADAQDQKVFAAANENAKGYASQAQQNAQNYADAKDSELEQRVTAAYKAADEKITKAYQAADEAIKQGVFIAEGIDKLNTKVKDMNKQMKSSFAAGAAMAALVPNARAEGNTHLAAGTGYYDGKLGAAIGLFHYVDDNVLLNAGLAYAGDDSFTAKGGVTVGF